MQEPHRTRLRYLAIGVIVVFHATVVPIVLRSHFASTSESCYVQITLLAIYFGFGSGNRLLRGILTVIGMASALVIEQCIAATLFNFVYSSSNAYSLAVGTAQWLFAPAAVLCLIFTMLRPLLGSIRRSPDHSTSRLGISDWFVVTLLAAVAMALLTFGLSAQADYFAWQVLAISSVPSAACAIGCILLALSRRWWWLGAVLLAADLSLEWLIFSQIQGYPFEWTGTVLPSIITIATLACFRLMGYELVRPSKVVDAAL